MINVIFLDEELERFFRYGKCSNREYNMLGRDKRFFLSFQKVIQMMIDCETTSDFKKLCSLHYEKLRNRPESSIRIMNGRVERLLFIENENGIEISIIEINTTHYGNKK